MVTQRSTASIATTIPRLANSVIRASAGTGKTFQLSSRYLQLILSGHLPERILATTFTRKAAGEILERILHRLAAAAQGTTSTTRLAHELEMPDLDVADCRLALQQLTRNLHRLRIGTLDSFLLQATQSLSLELGLPPGWQIVDELEEAAVRDEALGVLLQQFESATVSRLMHWLSKGDTHRGVYRLLSDTVEAMYQLYLESPSEAWSRLRHERRLDAGELTAHLVEVQSWLARGEGGKQLHDAVTKVHEMVAQQHWVKSLSGVLPKNLLAGDLRFHRKELPQALTPALIPLVQHARAEVQHQFMMQLAASRELLDRFHVEFTSLKLARRTLRFSDLPRYLGGIGRSVSMQQLAFRLDAHLDSLLLDEFQDTSLEQWRAIFPFAQHAAEPHANRSLLCVGDVKQAIYGWRGGNAELLDAIATELPAIEIRQLDQSFRSAPEVIDVVNRINQDMSCHPKPGDAATSVESWSRQFPIHSTARHDLPGFVSLETCAAGSDCDDERQQAIRLAADRAQQLRCQAPHLSIAVLVRTNEMVGRVIYALQQRGVMASEEGGNPLMDAAAVQLVVSLLQLADFPHDTVARFHLARSPWGRLLQFERHTDDAAAVQLSRSVRSLLLNQGYGAAVDHWVDQLTPLTDARECRRLGQLASLAYRYQAAIETPRQIGYHRQRRMPLRTLGFRQWIQQQRVADPTDDPVRVMNVHQSKGLQFDVVILPDLDRKLLGQTPNCVFDRVRPTAPIQSVMRYVSADLREFFPDWVQQLHDQHLAASVREDLCVLYVALTRAVHSLQMIVAPSEYVASDNDQEDQRRKANANSLPLSPAGLIRAALTDHAPLPPQTRIFQHGDPAWISRLSATFQPTKSLKQAALPPVRLAINAQGQQEAAARATVNPSRLEGGGRVRMRDRLSLPNQQAMLTGSVVHAFFEQIAWLEDGLPDDKQLVEVGMTLDANPQHIGAAIAQFHRQLANPQVSRLLSRQHYAEWVQRFAQREAADARTWHLQVRREQRLSTTDDTGFLTGNVDRLVLLMRDERPIAAEIIDFKTDAISSPAVLQARVAYYRPQLQAYIRGISQMLRIDQVRVSAKLLFVNAGELINVD